MAELEKASKPAPASRPQPPAPAPRPQPLARSAPESAAAGAGPPGGNGLAAHAAASKGTARPPNVIDLQGQATFPTSPELGEYIKQHGQGGADIRVKFGKVSKAGGLIRIASRDGKGFHTVDRAAIPIDHEFLAGPLAKINPHLRIQITDGAIGGWAAPAEALDAPHEIDKLIAKSGPAFGLAGFDLSALRFQNTIEGGVFKLGTPSDIQVQLAGWVTLTLGLGLENDAVRLSASGDVNVRGLGQGKLEIARTAGKVTGTAEMAVQLPKLSGKVMANYAEGAFSITGTLTYATEKLRGAVTVVVMEAADAEKAAKAQIDPQHLAAGATGHAEAGPTPEKHKKGERGIAGWGELDFAFTDWFTGKVKAVFDPAGHVTVIGKIAPPRSIELMGEQVYNTRLFGATIAARYGLPYVADIHVGIGVELGAAARLGPAVLSDIAIEGGYSTHPEALKALSITGTLRISAYAGLNLRLEGKAGLTVVDHDIDFGAAVTGTAGVKGYAEARPTLGYREKADPAAGKQGEYFLKGHLELAAQPFVALGGELFVKLDSPPWSPAPDRTWTWPLLSLEYPLPGVFGIAADIDHVIGSKQWPEIHWGKADFDAGKFTDSLLDRQIPQKKVGGDVQQPGTWKGEAGPAPAAAKPPGAAGGAGKAPGAGAPKLGAPAAKAATGGQKPEEARNVPKTPDASRRWLAGMKALGELHDRAEKDPETSAEIHAHLAAIKQKFGFTRLEPHLQGGYWVIDAALNPSTEHNTKLALKVKVALDDNQARKLAELGPDAIRGINRLADADVASARATAQALTSGRLTGELGQLLGDVAATEERLHAAQNALAKARRVGTVTAEQERAVADAKAAVEQARLRVERARHVVSGESSFGKDVSAHVKYVPGGPVLELPSVTLHDPRGTKVSMKIPLDPLEPKNGVVNVGGGTETPDLTNLNPINPGSGGPPGDAVQNLVKAGIEQMDVVFRPGSVRDLFSSKLRYEDINWNLAARSAYRAMAPGGRFRINAWTPREKVNAVITAFQDARFKEIVTSGAGPGFTIAGVK